MRKRVMLLGFVFLAVTIWSATAKAELAAPQKGRVGAELVLWWPTISGDATFDIPYVPGTSLDLDEILGIDPTATTIEFGVWVNPLKRYRLSVYWFLDKRTGNKILEQQVTVAGKQYIASAEIDSKLEVQRIRVLNEFAILRNDLGRIAVTGGVAYLDAIGRVSGFTSIGVGDSTGVRIQVPLPVFGLSGELHIPMLMGLGVFAEGSGFAVSYSEIDASYFDVRGGINFKTRFVYAQGGYQYIDLNLKAFDKLDVGFNMQGPFVSVGAKF